MRQEENGNKKLLYSIKAACGTCWYFWSIGALLGSWLFENPELNADAHDNIQTLKACIVFFEIELSFLFNQIRCLIWCVYVHWSGRLYLIRRKVQCKVSRCPRLSILVKIWKGVNQNMFKQMAKENEPRRSLIYYAHERIFVRLSARKLVNGWNISKKIVFSAAPAFQQFLA